MSYLVNDILYALKDEKTIINNILEKYKFISTNLTEFNSLITTEDENIKNEILKSLTITKLKNIPILLDLCFAYYLIKIHQNPKIIPIYRIPLNIFKFNVYTAVDNNENLKNKFKKIISNELIIDIYISYATIEIRNISTEKLLMLNTDFKELIEQILKLN